MARLLIHRFATIPLWTLLTLVALPTNAEDAPVIQTGHRHQHEPENFLRVTAGVYSGGEPRGDAMFDALARRGIRTAISVDGLAPDVDTALHYGIQYVHIPIGYDGIKPESAAALSKALRERHGPFYVHCHHGKHRGPAMGAIALRLKTGCDDKTIRQWLTHAAGSEAYRGLWRDALDFRPSDIEGLSVELSQKTTVSNLAGTMAELDRVWVRLQASAAADWEVVTGDSSSAHDALMLHEHFRELTRRNVHRNEFHGFTRRLRKAADKSRELSNALAMSDNQAASEVLESIRKSCKRCHRTWRD